MTDTERTMLNGLAMTVESLKEVVLAVSYGNEGNEEINEIGGDVIYELGEVKSLLQKLANC